MLPAPKPSRTARSCRQKRGPSAGRSRVECNRHDLGVMTPELRIGLSGWTYAHWRQDFYAGIPQRAWLQHAAAKFDALEINGSFYRLQSEAALARWYEETPPGFIFTAK